MNNTGQRYGFQYGQRQGRECAVTPDRGYESADGGYRGVGDRITDGGGAIVGMIGRTAGQVSTHCRPYNRQYSTENR